MIMKANKQIGFIYKDNESIDKILKDGDVVFERGFLREKTSTTLPITFGGVGKDLKDYKIYGNTYQNSTRGVNLFNHYLYPANNIYQGITITNNGDGSFTLNGTCTRDNTNFILGLEGTIREYATEGQVTQTAYYISGSCIKGSSSASRTVIRLNYALGPDKMIPLEKLNTQGVISKTISESSVTTGWSWTICLNAGDTFDNFTIKYQLEKGSEATDYEPYTGGQPSPNPDYPQEIISCGDRTKNLAYNFRNVWYSTNSNTFTDNNNFRSCMAKVNPNTTYTISKKNISNRFVIFASSVEINPTVPLGRQIRIAQNPDFTNYTFTTQNNENYIFFGYYSGTDEQEIISAEEEIMIEEGSTATDYEPYGYKIPVNVRSDNLCDGINQKYWLSATVLSAGMADGNSGLAIELKENTNYTISTQIIQERYRVALINTLPTSGTGIPCYNGVKKDGTKDNITISSSQYKYLILNATDLTKCQIVEGSTAPSKYIPYYNETTNIYLDEPLRKIDEYSDYIDFINGKVVRNISEIVLDGSESWATAVTRNNYNKVARQFLLENAILNQGNSSNITKSTHFGIESANNIYSNSSIGVNCIGISDSGYLRIGLDLTVFPGDNSFKTWLSENNVTVDYVLETPTEESITLPNIPTIDENNTLNIETEITPSQVYIKYKSNE